MTLPNAREDGICCDCCEKPAETQDGRFCKKCLRKIICQENPIPIVPVFNDQRGRTARPTSIIKGHWDMITTEDQEL